MSFKSFILVTLALFSAIPQGFAQDDSRGKTYLVQRILQRYTEAYGGFRDADALSSLSVEGTIEQGGQTFDFLMRKKRPYSFRYRLSSGKNSAITGYNGYTGWTRIETNGEVSIDPLEGQDLSKVRKMARFEGPLFRHLEKRGDKIKYLRRGEFEERSVNVLEVTSNGSRVSHYYIDTHKGHILRIDELDESGEITLQTIYRFHMEVEGYPFAHEVETRMGDKTLSLAKVGRINVNPGLLSFYFEEPKR